MATATIQAGNRTGGVFGSWAQTVWAVAFAAEKPPGHVNQLAREARHGDLPRMSRPGSMAGRSDQSPLTCQEPSFLPSRILHFPNRRTRFRVRVSRLHFARASHQLEVDCRIARIGQQFPNHSPRIVNE